MSPTPSQTSYYTSLRNRAETLSTTLDVPTIEQFAGLSVPEASKAIDAVKAVLAQPVSAPVEQAPASFHVHPGIYTVLGDGGARRTFRVAVQPSDSSFAAGQVILSFLAGADNDSDYVGFAFISGSSLRVWKRYTEAADLIEMGNRLMSDPDSALVSKNCARCGRTLTTPESIRSGFGPECVRKGLR